MNRQLKILICGVFLISGVGIASLFLNHYVETEVIRIEKKISQSGASVERLYWRNKIQTHQIFKIGIITDTQFHASKIDRTASAETAARMIKPKYKAPIDAFIAQMKIFQPDKLVHLGDIVEGTNDEDYKSIAGLELVRNLFNKTGLETYWVIGNHELRSVTREQFKEAMGIDYTNKWFDVGDYRVIVVDTNFHLEGYSINPETSRYIRGRISEENMNFLEESLKTKKRTIVLMHAPPFVAEDGVPRKHAEGLLDNAREVQELLDKYAATAVFGGHIERKRFVEKSGVQYFSMPGTHKNKYYKDCYYEVTINKDDIQVAMHYVDINTGEYVTVDSKDGEDLPYEYRSRIDVVLDEEDENYPSEPIKEEISKSIDEHADDMGDDDDEDDEDEEDEEEDDDD